MLDVDNYFLDKSIEFINNYAEEKKLEIILFKQSQLRMAICKCK